MAPEQLLVPGDERASSPRVAASAADAVGVTAGPRYQVTGAASLAMLALAIGCKAGPRPEQPDSRVDWTSPHAARYDSHPQPPSPARFKNPGVARYHMRMHFGDLRAIEHLLLSGQLDEGKTLAYLLVRRTDDPGIAMWQDHARQVADAALEITKATGIGAALRCEARVAVACAGCHIAAQSLPVFAPIPALPPDRTTPESRMARHVWAADRLWEGLVGADDGRWSLGLAVLSDTPLSFAPGSNASRAATELQTHAREQLEMRAVTVLEDRGTAYGEMLVACAACHAQMHANVARARARPPAGS